MKKKIDLSRETMKLIDHKQLKPIPRWEFVARNWLIWFLFLISFGVLTVGLALSLFGWETGVIAPHWWMITAGVFLLVSWLVFEKTKKAYRIEKWQAGLFILTVGLIAGGSVYLLGWANKIDKELASRARWYREMVPIKMAVWNNPNEGYLSGVVTKEIGPGEIEISDFEGKTWRIGLTNAVIRGRTGIAINSEIKLMGKRTGESEFAAEEVRPWGGIRENMLKEN